MAKINQNHLTGLINQELFDNIYFLEKVNSTNKFLQNKNFDKINICIAENQTLGVGRRGNVWHSQGENITFSIQYQFDLPLPQLSSLAIVVSILCAQSLQKKSFSKIKLKWPNDLIYFDKKLGGILVEQQIKNNKSQIIIGIGINAKMSKSIKIDQDWIDLFQINPNFKREEIIASIINNLLPILKNYQNQNLLNNWHKYDWHKNKFVIIYNDKKKILGKALGINQEGALILQTQQGKKLIYTGDISLRKL